MGISKNQNELHVNNIDAIFVPYKGCAKCQKCVFIDYEDSLCYGVPCCSEEREDGMEGYWRRTNVTAISYEIPNLMK